MGPTKNDNNHVKWYLATFCLLLMRQMNFRGHDQYFIELSEVNMPRQFNIIKIGLD